MGDRTSVWIRIGGQVKDLDALVEALDKEGMTPAGDAAIAHMRTSDPNGCEFTADEVNYGLCDDLEEELRRQGLAYEFHWHAGGEYGEGGHVFDTASGRWREYYGEGGGSTMTAREIRELKFATIEDLLTHFDAVDTFNPGPLIVPPPLVQAVLKARKEHGDAQDIG